MFFLTKSGLFSCFFIAKTHFFAVLPSKEKTMSRNGEAMPGNRKIVPRDKWIMSGDRKITSGDMCKFSRKFVRIVGSYFSIIVVYKNIVAVYKKNVESMIDILQPGLFISSYFYASRLSRTKKNQEKLIKTEVLLIKTCFSLFAFVFICFWKARSVDETLMNIII